METAMNVRQSLTLGLGALLAAVTFGAAAQSTPSSAAPGADKAAATRHGAAKQQPSSARRRQAAHEQAAARSQETPYHDALKQCVVGPADQRERWIDNAIARFARS